MRIKLSREKRELIRKYNSTADIYDSRYYEIQKRKIEHVRKYLDGFDKILDVGCGTGIFSEFGDEGRFVVGLDFSEEMLKRAKSRAGEKFLVVGDADMLPFETSAFDAVISLTLLQNMPSPERTIFEMVRVLKDEGRIILTVLEKKYSVGEVEGWLISEGVKLIDSGEIPGSEDVFCVGEKTN